MNVLPTAIAELDSAVLREPAQRISRGIEALGAKLPDVDLDRIADSVGSLGGAGALAMSTSSLARFTRLGRRHPKFAGLVIGSVCGAIAIALLRRRNERRRGVESAVAGA